MNFKTTLLLVLVVGALLLALKFYGGGDAGGPGTTSTEPAKLLDSLGNANVERIEVELVTREACAFEQRDRQWWMVDPLLDRASQSTIQNLIEVLLANPKVPVEPSPDLATRSKLELEPPRARVTLKTGDAKKDLRLRVGANEPTGQACYVMVEGDPALYRTGANLTNVLRRSRQEWRDDRLAAGDAALVQKVTLERPGEPPLVFDRPGAEWRMLEPRPFRADDSLLSQLVGGLLLLNVRAFEAVDPSPKQLLDFGIGAAGVRVQLDLAGRSIELRFGNRADVSAGAPRHVTDSVRKHLFLVEGPALALLDLPAQKFRDKQLHRIALANLTWLRMQVGGRVRMELKYEPSARRFDFVQPFQRPADDDRTGELYAWAAAFSALTAESFLDPDELPKDGDPYAMLGLADPAAILEFETLDRTGVVTRLRFDVGKESGGTFPVRPRESTLDTVYFIPAAAMHKVLDADARQFMRRMIVPDLLAMDRVHVKVAGIERTIERRGKGDQRYWFDAIKEGSDTNPLQSYLFKLARKEVTHFLPRDAQPSDGLDSPSATFEFDLHGSGSAGEFGDHLVIELGARDESGTLVFGRSSALPQRTVFTVESWVLDELAPAAAEK